MCLWKRQKTLFFGGQNMQENFSIVAKLARMILGILGSQIET
jgi:hypothetical protein